MLALRSRFIYYAQINLYTGIQTEVIAANEVNNIIELLKLDVGFELFF